MTLAADQNNENIQEELYSGVKHFLNECSCNSIVLIFKFYLLSWNLSFIFSIFLSWTICYNLSCATFLDKPAFSVIFFFSRWYTILHSSLPDCRLISCCQSHLALRTNKPSSSIQSKDLKFWSKPFQRKKSLQDGSQVFRRRQLEDERRQSHHRGHLQHPQVSWHRLKCW